MSQINKNKIFSLNVRLDSQQLADIFMIFNVSGDGSMSRQEFRFCYDNWIIKGGPSPPPPPPGSLCLFQIVQPRSAIIIVDVQNDFISGSLAISNCPARQNGEDVVGPINRMLDTVPFNLHCYSMDWHPSDHVSFIDNVNLRSLARDSPVRRPVGREVI